MAPRTSGVLAATGTVAARRELGRLALGLLRPLLVLCAALLVGAAVTALTGDNPLEAYRYLLLGAFTDPISFGETVTAAVPLVLTGLATAASFRAGIFNIGVEGQLMCGGLAASWFALSLPWLPAPLLLGGALLAGGLAGAVIAGIPGYLRAYFGTNEIVGTIMLNYIAADFGQWVAAYPLKDPTSGAPQSRPLPSGALLYQFDPATQLNAGIFVVIAVVIILTLVLYRTVFGYELRMSGSNPFFARYGGVPVRRILVQAMVLSGLIGGLCGAVEVLGVYGRFNAGYLSSPQWGYNGIVIALLANLEPLAVPLAAFAYAALQTGGTQIQYNTSMNPNVVAIIQALIFLFVTVQLGINFYRFRLHRFRFYRFRFYRFWRAGPVPSAQDGGVVPVEPAPGIDDGHDGAGDEGMSTLNGSSDAEE